VDGQGGRGTGIEGDDEKALYARKGARAEALGRWAVGNEMYQACQSSGTATRDAADMGSPHPASAQHTAAVRSCHPQRRPALAALF
jgi:hypothetical protein